MSAGAKVDVADGQGEELASPQAGLASKGEHRPVPPAGPSGRVRCAEERFDLFLSQIGDKGRFVALLRDRQDALDGGGVFRVAEGGIAEERVDRRQPRVACTDAVAALNLQVLQKHADELGVKIGDLELGRGLAGLPFGEDQQQLESVAIGGDGVRAGLALAGEPVGHVGLQGGGEAAHASSAQVGVEPLASKGHELGRGRQVPERVLRVCVPQKCRESRQHGRHVLALPVAVEQAGDRKCMPIMRNSA